VSEPPDRTQPGPVRSPTFGQRALASYLIGRTLLQQCVSVLAPLGIWVVPLKGVWLQQFVYPDKGERLITDVDVLVPQSRYAQARHALLDARWKLNGEDVSEASFLAPGFPLAVDLHAGLYTRGVFRTSLQGIFARARPDVQAFDCQVLLPDPLDVLSHLVGHALKGGNAWAGQGNELRDIPRLVQVFELSPERCAARLAADGLARAARFVLPLIAAEPVLAERILACLPADPVGVEIARAARTLKQLQPDNPRAHTVVGFMLDSSVWRAGYALSLRVLDMLEAQRRAAARSSM
jgi:hypothetical protein